MVVQEVTTMVELFADVATNDPLSFLLVLMGALVIGFASAVFGYLALRGAGTLFSAPPGQGPPQQAR